MARETFISYKYSEARDTRNAILEAMGNDATYYRGETSASPKLQDDSTEGITNVLKDMIYDTSVLIIVISPNFKESNWIDWEIEYSLKQYKRGDRTSRTNGIVGVIQEFKGNYDWFLTRSKKPDGCISRSYTDELLYEIIKKNRFNKKHKSYYCSGCETYSQLNDSYISFVEESLFLENHNKYIENAYQKSQKVGEFNIFRQRDQATTISALRPS